MDPALCSGESLSGFVTSSPPWLPWHGPGAHSAPCLQILAVVCHLRCFLGEFAVAGKVLDTKLRIRGCLLQEGDRAVSLVSASPGCLFFFSPPAWTMLHPSFAVCF